MVQERAERNEERGLVAWRKDRPRAIIHAVTLPVAQSGQRTWVAVGDARSLAQDPNVAVKVSSRFNRSAL